jgi:CHAT domain-containing protein
LIGLVTAGSLAACQTDSVPPKQAKTAPIGLEQPRFTPPPRRLDDIEAMLKGAVQPPERRTDRLLDRADRRPPATDDPRALARFHVRRAQAWGGLGKTAERLKDLHAARTYFDRLPPRTVRREFRLRREIARLEVALGSYRKGIAELRSLLAIRPTPAVYADLIHALIRTGQLDEAAEVQKRAIARIDRIEERAQSRMSDERRTAFRRQRARIMVMVLQSQGRTVEAERHIRALLATFPRAGRRGARQIQRSRISTLRVLVLNLLRQGRVTEAELAAREALETSLKTRGLDHPMTAACLGTLARVMEAMKRPNDAERLLIRALQIYASVGLSNDSTVVASARFGLSTVRGSLGKWKDALGGIQATREGLRGNRDYFDVLAARNVVMPLALIKMGRPEDAVRLLERQIARDLEIYGEGHRITAARRGALGMALAELGRTREALEVYRAAVPVLVAAGQASPGGGEQAGPRAWGVRVILESYVEFLTRLKRPGDRGSIEEDSVFEALRTADVMKARTVDRALGANVVRAAAGNDELSGLIRRHQDLERQLQALYGTLANVVALPQDERDSATVAALNDKIAVAGRSKAQVLETISDRYPRFRELARPKPIDLQTLRESLKPNEAVISTYVTDRKTYVWAIAPSGPPAFAAVALGREELAGIVGRLREAVDSDARTLGEVPPFDVGESHRLFRALLLPVASAWKGADSLLVAADGPLGQVPFHLLVTEDAPLRAEGGVLFSRYRRVAWLARSHSVTSVPSVASIVALRRLPEEAADRRPFFGVGDPVFNLRQAAEAGGGAPSQLAQATRSAAALRRRGITGLRALPTATLERLPRLLDTGAELVAIARLLKADLGRDVLLGTQATEQAVRSRDLTPYRILSFATHGLIPGDLDGLTEPALALASPKVTNTGGDGILTMSEILGMRLNADWVLLSACNTGAAGGAGAEAFSGLGRAFFYAGARALLLSNWPVHSAATADLMRHIFEGKAGNRALSRSRALRDAMLRLIDGPGFKDPGSGRVLFSYAHPLFWAPFVILGDGAGGEGGG